MFYISFAVALISEGFAIQLFFGDLNGDKVALQSYAFISLAIFLVSVAAVLYYNSKGSARSLKGSDVLAKVVENEEEAAEK
jgi:hypothetical protein